MLDGTSKLYSVSITFQLLMVPLPITDGTTSGLLRHAAVTDCYHGTAAAAAAAAAADTCSPSQPVTYTKASQQPSVPHTAARRALWADPRTVGVPPAATA